MSIMDIMKERRAFSFEIFPPKTDAGMEKLSKEGGVLDHLYTMNPDYISCTYGAGGTNAGRSLETVKLVKDGGRTIPMTHFTCIGMDKDDLRSEMQRYLDNGIAHILCLRGDFPYGWKGTGGDLHYASELVKFVRTEFGDKFTIGVAGSPETHMECRSFESDVSFLRQKQDVGADFVITQLCWDMEQFGRWMDAIDKAGVTMPIDVGIMPVLDIAAIINMSLSHNGCAIPRDLAALISNHWIFPNPFAPGESDESVAQKKADFRKAGMEFTAGLIDRYRSFGIAGIHLYALNKWEDVTELVRMTGLVDII